MKVAPLILMERNVMRRVKGAVGGEVWGVSVDRLVRSEGRDARWFVHVITKPVHISHVQNPNAKALFTHYKSSYFS